MSNYLSHRVLRVVLPVLLISIVLGVIADRWNVRYHHEIERERVRAAAVPYANLVAASVARRVSQMGGLKVFVETRSSSAQLDREFSTFSTGLLANARSIRAIEIVRRGVIDFVEPLKGNEAAKGHDIARQASAETRADYERAMTTAEVTISGPIQQLVQGGHGLVLRQRARAPYDPSIDLVALVIYADTLVQEVEFEKAPKGVLLQLYDRHGRLLAASNPGTPDRPEQVSIPLRDGIWWILAAPTAGWNDAIAGRVIPVRVAIVLIVLLVAIIAAVLADQAARLDTEVKERTAAVLRLMDERGAAFERQRAHEAVIAANEERLRFALAAARMGTFEVDAVSGAVQISPEFASMLGVDASRAPRTMSEVMRYVEPGDREAAARATTRAGSVAGQGEVEYRVSAADGQRRWVAATWLSIPGADGQVQRVIGTVADISERKNLEEQFLHAQKMQAVGSLAGGIAHDFNNLLTVILGTAQMARSQAAQLPAAGDLGMDLEEILAAAERASVLTGQLLAFSRRQVVQPRLVDVGELVAGMSGMLKRLVGERITVVTTSAPSPARVWADPGQLTQVVMNLSVNARDAMREGGTLRIHVGHVTVAEDAPPPAEGLAPGEYVKLSVSDSGEGIDPRIAHLIFDPFFTTKPVGQGTGLGLSTVYGIARQWHGSVRFDSTRGEGTTFEVFLPTSHETHLAEATRATSLQRDAAGRTILLAEDEPGLRRLVERELSEAGFRVIATADGEAALARAEEWTGALDLLLTDVVMPGRSGVEVADQLRRERPTLRVLLMSGYPMNTEPSDLAAEHVRFLAKPFSPAALLDAVFAALGTE